jgi:hypothetical protein
VSAQFFLSNCLPDQDTIHQPDHQEIQSDGHHRQADVDQKQHTCCGGYAAQWGKTSRWVVTLILVVDFVGQFFVEVVFALRRLSSWQETLWEGVGVDSTFDYARGESATATRFPATSVGNTLSACCRQGRNHSSFSS